MSGELQKKNNKKNEVVSVANSLASIVDNYIAYYASGNSHTSRAKRLDLNHFTEFLCQLRSVKSPSHLKITDWDFSSVQRFIDYSLTNGEAPATVSRRLATLKHMGRTFADKVPGFINPAREVKAPRLQPPRPKALTPDEIEEIRSYALNRKKARNSFARIRNETLFNFLLDTGLRADEVRLLKMSQIDDNLDWIENVRTKGRKYRNVYITSAMRTSLREYLVQRDLVLKKFYAKLTYAQNKSLPLFLSTYKAVPNEPQTFLMGAKSIWRAINELSSGTKLHPHLLRHSFATDLLTSSNDVRLVAQALGHSDVRITMRYTQRMDEEVAKALEKSRKGKK